MEAYWHVRSSTAYLHLAGVGDLAWARSPEVTTLPDGPCPSEYIRRLEADPSLSGPLGMAYTLIGAYQAGVISVEVVDGR